MTMFQGFCPTSFEQFIRVMALEVLGPGINVLGAGPDGGREACFNGIVPYPFPPAEQWNGYGIIQAKYKRKLETTAKDQCWAAAQLLAELQLWLTRKSRSPKPDYFIFCTNVELTSGPRGGRARLENLLAASANALGLKDFRIWDGLQLRAFVDRYESVRSRFCCFLTPGDLIAQFTKKLSWGCDPDSVLTAFLCRELLHDEDARLSQAGDRSEDRIKLADVFVDLPVADGKRLSGADGRRRIRSLRELATIASSKLDPLTLQERATRIAHGTQRRALNSRYLLIGGFGSGKSTIEQFLAQMHRAALLARRPEHRLEPRIRNIIAATKARCEDNLAEWPATPRFPIRIELNSFAQALASKEDDVATLSAYVRRLLSRDVRISHAELRSWLSTYPWLIILDGLDEVPSSSNRTEVVAAIQHFLSEARDIEADLLVVASTRPDGYNGELDGDDVTTRTLLPLPARKALAYARRYIDARFATNDDPRSTALLSTVSEAIKTPLVARLMTSPLQVTFMVAVIGAIGRPSESRWQLFNDYYRTIYERELHKAVRPFNRILHERRQDIDALHSRLGYLLQARGESIDGVETALSVEEFEDMVDAVLREDGLDSEQLTYERRMIVEAAQMRLVFITSRKSGRLSFEVRSLQEFLAAAYLTDTDTHDILPRLKAIARSAHWRNTLLFAIGRFFVEPRMRRHRDQVRLLCEDLNREDPQDASVKSGSRLALEILESGVVGDVPQFNRSLAECALKLLEIPPGTIERLPARLAKVYDETMQPEFHSAVSIWLGQMAPQSALSAWLLVLLLEQAGVTWAGELAKSRWPSSPETGLMIITLWFGLDSENHWRVDKDYRVVNDPHRLTKSLSRIEVLRLDALLPRMPLLKCYRLITGTSHTRVSLCKRSWVHPLRQFFSIRRWLNLSASSTTLPDCAALSLVGVVSRKSRRCAAVLLSRMDDTLHESWRQLKVVLQFTAEPTASSLATALLNLHRLGDAVDLGLCAQFAPWPLACCLASDRSQRSLESLAIDVANGALGCIEQWTALEMRWRKSGLSIAKCIAPLHRSSLPLIGAVARVDTDVAAIVMAPKEVVKALVTLAEALPPSYARHNLNSEIATIATLVSSHRGIDPSTVREHLIAAASNGSADFMCFTPDTMSETNLDFCDALGSSPDLMSSAAISSLSTVPMDELLLAFLAQPRRVGLLRSIAAWVARGRTLQPATLSRVAGHAIWNVHRWAHVFVQICRTDLTEREARALAIALPEAMTSTDAPGTVLNMLITALRARAANAQVLHPILLAACSLIPATQWQLLADVQHIKYRFLLACPSTLSGP